MRGFTLLELMVVLIIVGILATLGASRYGRTVERSRQAEAISALGTLRGAQLRFAAENNGNCTSVITDLDVDVAAPKYFTYSIPVTPLCNDADFTTAIARATRNGVQQTAGDPSYNITVAENGDLICPTGDCAGGP
ncbi:prepilin-type N-terminal cleavage/methylation domain-containing protein [bacterium]|nr:MAG: prepilin-type N-terminal cleavage/methylation domain-containing protein [bacterium]